MTGRTPRARDRHVRRCTCGGWVWASQRECPWCGVELDGGSAASPASRLGTGSGSEPPTPNQQDTIELGRVFPCPRCGASVHADFAACPWCDHTIPERAEVAP